MAFRRADGGRALGAPRARQLQPRTRAAASRPWFGPTLQSRATHSPSHQKPPSGPGTLQRRRQGTLGGTPASIVCLCHGRRRPSHPGSPPAPGSRASLSPRSSASSRRLHVALQATERRFAGDLILGRGTAMATLYKKHPSSSRPQVASLTPSPTHP